MKDSKKVKLGKLNFYGSMSIVGVKHFENCFAPAFLLVLNFVAKNG